MKTPLAVWFAGEREIELRETQVGSPGANDVRIKAVVSGISHGTEMLVYRGQVPLGLEIDLPTFEGSFGFPIKYGYASVGRVAETGRNVREVSPGDLVFALHPHQTEYVIPLSMVVKLPDSIAPDSGVFVANLETALNALLDAPIRLGETVVVFGQGIVGLLIMQLARRAGAGKVIVVDPFSLRRDVALRLGADLALGAGQEVSASIRESSGGRGADLVFEASGSPAGLQQAIESVATEGTVVVCSWYGAKDVNLRLGAEFHRRRIRLRSSQVGNLDPCLAPRWDRKRRMSVVLDLLPHLELGCLISHRCPIEQAEAAYELIDQHPEQTLQVILTYEGGR